MRKTMLFAVTVVAAIIAVLVVMLPGLGFGQTQTVFGHGGTPTDVYTRTFDSTGCAGVVLDPDGEQIMHQNFTLQAESNVVVWFTFQLVLESSGQRGSFQFGLDRTPTNQAWVVTAPGSTTAKSFGTAQSTTLMWSFDNVALGDHDVQVFAAVSPAVTPSQLNAELNGCAMTVLVNPVAE